jgi:hypothetical protein
VARLKDLLDAQDANAAAKGMTYQTLDRNIPGVYYCLINSQYLHFEGKGGIGMNHQKGHEVKMPVPIGIYAQEVFSGEHLWVSGQLGVDPKAGTPVF